MSNTKVIRINKRCATPQDYARARGRMSPLSDNFGPLGDEQIVDSSNTSVDWGKTANVATNIGGKIVSGSKGRVGKKKFYDYRDSVFKAIGDVHGHEAYKRLPGDPFKVFSHAAIKDSPLKNYAKELDAFKAMFKKYYPEIYGQLENETIVQQRKTNAGVNIPDGAIEDILAGVSSDYINSLAQKRNAGLPLTSAEQKILDAYEYLHGKIREGVEKKVKQDIGEWMMNNWYIVLLGLLILVMAFKKK